MADFMPSRARVLVLAPHTDDGEMGCGATVARLLEEDAEVHYVAFSTCETSVPEGFPTDVLANEVREATRCLGIPPGNLIIKDYPVRCFPEHRQDILEDLVRFRRELDPELVFLPASCDVHQDHATLFQEGRRAFKHTRMLGYEFMWNAFSFQSTLFSPVDEQHVTKKIASLEQYASQSKRFYTAGELIRGLARYRGLQIMRDFAEAFEVIRWIL